MHIQEVENEIAMFKHSNDVIEQEISDLKNPDRIFAIAYASGLKLQSDTKPLNPEG